MSDDVTVLDWLEPVFCPYCGEEAEKWPEDACWECLECDEVTCI